MSSLEQYVGCVVGNKQRHIQARVQGGLAEQTKRMSAQRQLRDRQGRGDSIVEWFVSSVGKSCTELVSRYSSQVSHSYWRLPVVCLQAQEVGDTAVGLLKDHNRRTLDVIGARIYFYYSYAYECLGRLADVRRCAASSSGGCTCFCKDARYYCLIGGSRGEHAVAIPCAFGC